MSRRIDIELTSTRPDGTWTWRAAGAREPKGVLDGGILPGGAKVGDVLKAEADLDVDGITILSVAGGGRVRKEPNRLEIKPSDRPFEPISVQLAQRDRSGDGRRPRRDRPGGDGRGDRRAPREGREPRDRNDRGDSRRGPEGEARAPRGDRPPRERREQRPHFAPPPEMPQRPKAKRLKPGRAHRTEVLAAIPEEQRAIAELALQGQAAVRQRIREHNTQLKAEGKPEMPEPSVMRMAEELMPKLRVAEWLDRAEAAQRDLDDLDLKDLRSVVASGEDPIIVRDESTRSLAATLKTALAAKQEKAMGEWLEDIATAVEIGRVVRALKMAGEPPKAGTRLPEELAARLAGAAAAGLTADASSERWIALVESVAFSPVRTLVTPAAAPTQVSDELRTTITRLAPAVPQIAALFGVSVAPGTPMPKPPRGPRRPERKPAQRPAEPGVRGNARPVAAPPAPDAAAPDPAPEAPSAVEPVPSAEPTHAAAADANAETEPTL